MAASTSRFSEQRGKHPCKTLPQSDQERTLHPLFHFRQQYGLLLVIQEQVLHPQSHLLIIEEHIRLEIILKTTEVYIR